MPMPSVNGSDKDYNWKLHKCSGWYISILD